MHFGYSCKNMKKTMMLQGLLGITAIFIISGCISLPSSSRRSGDSGDTRIEKPLPVAASLRFEDIPIPADFNIIRDQSFVFQDGNTRVGLMRYTGRANSNQVVTFFKNQMSLYNWDLINIVEYGHITLNFTKSSESCVITVEPLATKTIIGVMVSPKTGSMSASFGPKKDKF